MKLLITIVLLLYPFSLQAYTNDISQNIRELDKQISATNDKTKRAQFYSYKARQYRNNGEDELSIKSYLNSLQQHETGDTWSELGNIYFKVGQYEKSAKVANHMLKNFPAFKVDATDLLKKSKTKLHAIYLKENPPTIIVNSDYFGPKVDRKSVV